MSTGRHVAKLDQDVEAVVQSAGKLVVMAQPTPAELEHIRELLSVVTPLQGQLERLQQIVDAEAGELSPTALSLLQQRQAKSA